MAGSEGSTSINSPMELATSWSATPGNSGIVVGSKCKRKSDDDSGYVTPCSFCMSKCEISVSTPKESRDSSGFKSNGSGGICFEPKEMCIKKRLISCDSQDGKSLECYCTNSRAVDSFTEYLYTETSLYAEQMDTSPQREPSFCNISRQESLGFSEDSKKIDVDISMDMEVDSLFPKACENLFKRDVWSPMTLSPSIGSPIKSRDIVTIPRRELQRPRSMVGFEKLDIMFYLGAKSNQSLVISRILSYLTDNDISSVTMVSRTWKNICLRDTKTKSRWLKYISERKERKENLGFISCKSKNGLTPLLTRNHSTPLQTRQPSSPPVSPSKVRFNLFQKEARKLKSDETLATCPRCSLPSACSPSLNLGQCKRISCQMRFCTICRRPYHENSPCDGYFTPTTTTPKKRPTTIGSKESRRNLRRL